MPCAHLLPFLVVSVKLKPLGGWLGFTWERIDSMLEAGCAALSVKYNDDFDVDDDDDADNLLLHGSSEDEGLGWDSEGCVDVGSDSYDNASVGLVLLSLTQHDEGLKISFLTLSLMLFFTYNCPMVSL